jgi:hypothetical protein
MLAVAIIVLAQPVWAQTDPANIPEPPTAEMMRLQPFLGSYTVSGQYLGMDWAGSLDLRPAVRGWYLEWEINVHSGPIDRQLRMMITWDAAVGHYRIWRFETAPPFPAATAEGTGRLENGEFVMEWDDVSPDGRPGTFRNRLRMEGSATLVVITEAEPASGEGGIMRIGVTTGRRRM